ncbi:MAG: hypothetical protein M5R42_07450 [Rhodocyclaceae bacterium]|nr:hypothetical protein [Rhodocyclaceae bacterium]
MLLPSTKKSVSGDTAADRCPYRRAPRRPAAAIATGSQALPRPRRGAHQHGGEARQPAGGARRRGALPVAHGLPTGGVCWPSLRKLDWIGAGLGMEDRPARGDDLVGVTGCFCAIAETGTLMLLSGADTPAAASLYRRPTSPSSRRSASCPSWKMPGRCCARKRAACRGR